jgi:hypothetical protein
MRWMRRWPRRLSRTPPVARTPRTA